MVFIKVMLFDLDENSFGVHFHHSDSNECEEMCLRDVTIMVHPEGNQPSYWSLYECLRG